jgi:hypothetical protein
MSIHTESISRARALNSGHHDHDSPARRHYIRPAALRVDCPLTPQHWDLTSRDGEHDVSEEDGYVLSANGEGSTSGVFMPCEPLSAVRRARLGRLRVKPTVLLHRRRAMGITTSPISPTATVSTYFLSSVSHLPTNSPLLNGQSPLSPPLASSSVIAFLSLP